MVRHKEPQREDEQKRVKRDEIKTRDCKKYFVSETTL